MGLPTDGIGDLESETIRSVEGGVAYVDDHLSLSAAAFANRTERSLDGVTYMGVNIFQNGSGETDSMGSEVEAQVAPWRDLRFLASYAWSEAKDDDGHELEDIPRHKTNFGVIYRWNDLTAAATLRWVSGYRTPFGPDTDGTVLVDANLGWDFSRRFRAELAGRNLLDEDTKLPKHGREDVPQTGLRVLATIVVGY
jgi:outer membrane receptor protein involved in Fe transport